VHAFTFHVNHTTPTQSACWSQRELPDEHLRVCDIKPKRPFVICARIGAGESARALSLTQTD